MKPLIHPDDFLAAGGFSLAPTGIECSNACRKFCVQIGKETR